MFKIEFDENELLRTILTLRAGLDEADPCIMTVGTLDDYEIDLLAKHTILQERLETFCNNCNIMCDVSCPLHHSIEIRNSLMQLLELHLQNRLNTWQNGRMYFSKDFVVQLDPLQVEIKAPRQFATYPEPQMPAPDSEEFEIEAALLAGHDALALLDPRYRKKR